MLALLAVGAAAGCSRPAAGQRTSTDAGAGGLDAGADTAGADAGPPCLPTADAGVATAPDAGLVLVADTRAGFSATQGTCSWSYGYEEPAGDAGARAFHLMTDWDPGYPAWWTMRGTYWTLVAPDVQHANGTVTTQGRSPVEQWSVRRWTSTVSGPITITGSVRKVVGSEAGNGVDARIVVDGVEKYAHFVDAADTVGVSFAVSASVAAGSSVDFVLDPHQSNDLSDTTFFAAQIWR